MKKIYLLLVAVATVMTFMACHKEKEVEETVEARTFGNIVHGTLEDLYTPFLNEILTEEHIKKMQPLVLPIIEKRFEEEYRSTDFRTGKNWLIFNVIEKYVRSFLTLELNEIKSGIEIIPLYLEQKIKIPFQASHLPFLVNFKGIIDRVDRRNGVLHIIDYKTGIVEETDVRIKDWNNLITDIKYGKAFQLLTYAYMITQHFKIDEPMIVANLSFKRLQKGFLRFHTYIDKVKDCDVTAQTLALYSQYTEQLLQEIFDIERPFYEKL